MTNEIRNLALLLQFDDGPPLPIELTTDSAQKMPDLGKETAASRDFTDELSPLDDLAAQRWGVIVPEGSDGDLLLTSLAPLIEHRARQQAIAADEVVVLRAPAQYDLSHEAARTWRERVFDVIPRWERPSYLLILGDLHQVPESIHRTLTDRLVGRLAFSDASGAPDLSSYRKYAEKVLRWESHPADVREAAMQMFAVQDGTSATELGTEGLLKPLLELAAHAERRFPASAIPTLEQTMLTSKSSFLESVAHGPPAALLTISHGYGGPRGGYPAGDGEQQRKLQGGMCFGRSEGRLYGDELAAQRAFLPGGIWFLFACYGAGTPARSHYRHWLEALQSSGRYSASLDHVLQALPAAGERPFIAALPQAALRHAEGPLACIGHLDLAWSYSFEDHDTGRARRRPEAFFELLRLLLRRGPVGLAFLQLTEALRIANDKLAALYDTNAALKTAPAVAQLGHLWMLRQDLAGYILLGDPAVRLPLRFDSP